MASLQRARTGAASRIGHRDRYRFACSLGNADSALSATFLSASALGHTVAVRCDRQNYARYRAHEHDTSSAPTILELASIMRSGNQYLESIRINRAVLSGKKVAQEILIGGRVALIE